MKKLIFLLVMFHPFFIHADNTLVARNHSNSTIKVLFAAEWAADCDSDYDLPDGTSTAYGCKFVTLKPTQTSEHVFDWWNTLRSMLVYDEGGNRLTFVDTAWDNEYFIVYGEYPNLTTWDTWDGESNPFFYWEYADKRWVMEEDGTIKRYKRRELP